MSGLEPVLLIAITSCVWALCHALTKNRYTEDWLRIALTNTISASAYSSVSSVNANKVLIRATCASGSMSGGAGELRWYGVHDGSDPSIVQVRILVQNCCVNTTQGVYITVDTRRIWLRWRVEQRHSDISVWGEWVGEPTTFGQDDAIISSITQQCLSELGALSQANQLFQQPANGLPSGSPAPTALSQGTASLCAISSTVQTNSNSGPTGSEWQDQGQVKIPSRYYNLPRRADPGKVVSEVISPGGFLVDPIGGVKVLRWEGISAINRQDPNSVEVHIEFSDYGTRAQAAELTDELAMQFTFEYKIGGPATRMSCQWKGNFKPSSGDLVRELLSLVEAELLTQTGMTPPLRSTSARGQQTARGSGHHSPTSAAADTSKRIFWPTLQDFNEVIQNPRVCFADEELRNGQTEQTRLGLPKVATGAFASVYRMRCGQRDWAVRCFNAPTKDHQDRYTKTSRFICADNLTYTVPLQYLEKGIRAAGQWFPILKMEWVEGVPLNMHIEQNLHKPGYLTNLREKFYAMMQALREAGIAHSDLQHGNIIIRDDEFVLVDYDGMFVPELSGYLSNERGHPNYQHPARDARHFGPYVDNFSAWIIDSCLLCLIHDPQLWNRFANDGESLLFKRSDLERPDQSGLFALLTNHEAEQIKTRGLYLRTLLDAPLERVPFLSKGIPALLNLNYDEHKLSEAEVQNRQQLDTPPKKSGLPDWLQ